MYQSVPTKVVVDPGRRAAYRPASHQAEHKFWRVRLVRRYEVARHDTILKEELRVPAAVVVCLRPCILRRWFCGL